MAVLFYAMPYRRRFGRSIATSNPWSAARTTLETRDDRAKLLAREAPSAGWAEFVRRRQQS